ncbi:hypothetical protein A2U01_0061538, partial [Trifolium medium]|nr:hypothetical protein [Trifolium medium]
PRTPRVPATKDHPRQVAVPLAVGKTVEQYEAEVLSLKAEVAELKKAKGKEKVVDKGWLVAIFGKIVGETVDRKMNNILKDVECECRGIKEEVAEEVMKELSNNF